MDEGWSRLMFEQFNIPVKPLMDAEIRKGDLNASYDVIILPADSVAAMTGETGGRRRAAAAAAGAAAGGGRGGEGAGDGGGRQGGTPPAYRSGFGADGVKMLQAFVQKGGTLVTFGQAGDLPIQRFGLPAPQRRRRTAVEGVLVAGIDAARALRQPPSAGVRHAARGLRAVPRRQPGLRSHRRRPRTSRSFSTFVDREILQSGWLLGESVIAKKAAARLGRARRRQGGAARLPAAASRSDARHVQAGLQRAVHAAAGGCADLSAVAGRVKGEALLPSALPPL